jgi:histidinol dehydrogenase
MPPLPEITLDETLARRAAVVADPALAERVATIIRRIRGEGADAFRAIAAELGDPEPRWVDRTDLESLAGETDDEVRALLDRTAARVRRVADAQLPRPIEPVEQAGTRTSVRLVPVRSAACYAPAGRHPLPSSAIMGLIPARVAGVDRAFMVTPALSPLMAAAAVSAGADGALVAGGAQAVAACAFGVDPAPRADVVVGPGNAYVAEAKRQLVGTIGIEGVAGPSEVCVVAGGAYIADLVAADLLAQAEHDTDAEAVLLLPAGADDAPVQRALEHALADLATAETAKTALSRRGALIRYENDDDLVRILDALATEHLALHLPIERARQVATRVAHAGAIFVGERSGEVLGDYGAGPNHTLPTGGAARFSQGLAPRVFLRERAELEAPGADPALLADVARLAELEGLAAHRLAATLRMGSA